MPVRHHPGLVSRHAAGESVQSARQPDAGAHQVSVGADGRVDYVQRFSGEISSYHELSRCPFDRQAIGIDMTPRQSDRDEVVFVPAADGVSVAQRLNIEGWRIEGVVVGRLVMKGAADRARQLDRACRKFFPLLLLFGWGALAL
jgi:hypothetical protein